MSVVVHFYGGPGTGKSTTNALTFGALKQLGYNVEMAHELAKELTWEKRHEALGYQPYVIAKQMWRTRRLDGQVDAILTDTSILLGLIYGQPRDMTPAFEAWIVDEYRRLDSINIFLERDPERGYNPAGRSQTEEEAEAIDTATRGLLDRLEIPYTVMTVSKETNRHVDMAVTLIEKELECRRR